MHHLHMYFNEHIVHETGLQEGRRCWAAIGWFATRADEARDRTMTMLAVAWPKREGRALLATSGALALRPGHPKTATWQAYIHLPC